MTKEKMEGPTNMKLEQACNDLHIGIYDGKINYNVAVSPFSLSGENK